VLTALQACGGSLSGQRVAVLAATGPVGQRVARLLGRLGAIVAVGSRSLARASELATRLSEATAAEVKPLDMNRLDMLSDASYAPAVIVSAGPIGVNVLPKDLWQKLTPLRVLIDLNAVPPLGIEGVEANDKDKGRSGVRAWGALGVGGTKMKIHKKAIQQLFAQSDQVMDAEEVFALGQLLE
jgi:glutamyl-tRNA reductase